MGYLGSRFTWKGGIRESRKRVFKRLDRGLANPIWRLVNPEAKLEVLTRINSDHHPLCLTTNPDRVDRGMATGPYGGGTCPPPPPPIICPHLRSVPATGNGDPVSAGDRGLHGYPQI
ncbi:hypothetical protein Ahy_B01g055099 [Arachis hypogaea]|uniref:Uncharacterized protein n=1 Tax=Arachis hypogaea TaxID=3818 RepID=A0A445AV42_ARAHY|nr:hypothetical protein Ahy_B01g055099 [Arachis hypogaea]